MVFSSLKQRRLVQTKVHFKFFYSVRIEMTRKPWKEAAAKKFSSVYAIDATCFDECFSSVEDVIFSKSLSLPYVFFSRRIVVFFETSVLEEVRILHYLHNNNTLLIPKFQNVAIVYGCSFAAKLSWKKILFWKNICVFCKIYIICRKNVFIWKESFILKIFFTEINIFYREKYKWKCKKVYASFEKYIFMQKMFLLQIKYK